MKIHRGISLFCFLSTAILPQWVFGESQPPLLSGEALPQVVLKPKIQTGPPVDSRHSNLDSLQKTLEYRVSTADWILDGSTTGGSRIGRFLGQRQMADLGQRVVIETQKDGNGEDLLTPRRPNNVLHNPVMGRDEKELLEKQSRVAVIETRPVAYDIGDLLTVHRPEVQLQDPVTGEEAGVLSRNLGQVEVVEKRGHETIAKVINARFEILSGDRVDLFSNERIPVSIKEDPGFSGSARIIHIENDLDMAGQGQVIVVGLGLKDRVYPGLKLPLYKTAITHFLAASSEGSDIGLDTRPVGQAVLFRIGRKASLAFISKLTDSVERGDRIGVEPLSDEHETP